MTLSAFKLHLASVSELIFMKPDGAAVPQHFHVTEIGQIEKKYIDCGGTIRQERVISMQLWESVDVWHRLAPSKLLGIIALSEEKLGIEDLEIEVEYQAETIGKFGLSFSNNQFQLVAKNTTCLAPDNCGIPVQKAKRNLSELKTSAACCGDNTGCC